MHNLCDGIYTTITVHVTIETDFYEPDILAEHRLRAVIVMGGTLYSPFGLIELATHDQTYT